jgi:predicted AlkP superfamily phosphohydrolase/phosphomutase
LLSDINWSKTKAYAIGFGAIYINQKGRERDGIVAPGQNTKSLKEEIAQKLSQWTDAKYNQSVVSKVYGQQEIFHGDYALDAPDLYIGFNTGYRASWQTAMGGVPQDTIEDNLKAWSGDHLFDPALVPGVIFINKKISKDRISIYDITPTILKIVGYSDEELNVCDFDGASML